MTINLALHLMTGLVFALGTYYGAKALSLKVDFRDTVLFITLAAAANLVFRVWLIMLIIFDVPRPQPFTLQAALLLQIALGTSIALVLGVVYLRRRAESGV